MRSRLLLLGVALAAAAATVAAAPREAAAQERSLHHAAVVIDTGDGQVRKLCLAFPEAEIDGIEALRRVDTRPNRFEAYGAKGAAVCMLCGVGCPSGDCFCNPSRYWAYHRAGPGESSYQPSRVGASATTVRDGDVEAWRWGQGEAPAKTTVSEVCDVPEPPGRTAGGAGATTTTAAPTVASAPPPTAAPSSPSTTSDAVVDTAQGAGGAVAPGAPHPTTPGSPAPTAPVEGAHGDGPPPSVVAGTVPQAVTDPAARAGAERAAAPSTNVRDTSHTRPNGAGIGAFVVVLAGVLAWRARLRRANVRRMTAVR